MLAAVRGQPSPMAKFSYLSALRDENETLFFRALIDNLEELVPIVYTPTIGQACLDWSRIYQRPRGLYITPRERGRIAAVLRAWPQRDVRIIVVTDGGRILGLGDLGANGMGIPIGKLALYVACAGVDPRACLPVTLDVGTDNASVREEPLYLGRREPRLAGPAYDELIEEFVAAAQAVFPGVLVQFEDFANANAFRLLAAYRARVCCVQRRHPGHRRDGARGPLRRAADHRRAARPISACCSSAPARRASAWPSSSPRRWRGRASPRAKPAAAAGSSTRRGWS